VTNQLAIPNKRSRFGPKVCSRNWWIDRIKESEPKYINYWTHYTMYQIGQFKALAELDYQVLGERVGNERAPDSGLAVQYPIKLAEKPFWLTWEYKTFKSGSGLGFKQPMHWTCLPVIKQRSGSITCQLRVTKSRQRNFWIPSGRKTRLNSTFFCKWNTI